MPALCVRGGLGWSLGEYDLPRIIAGEMIIPPRAWYFLHFGALAVVTLAALEFLSSSFFTPVTYSCCRFSKSWIISLR